MALALTSAPRLAASEFRGGSVDVGRKAFGTPVLVPVLRSPSPTAPACHKLVVSASLGFYRSSLPRRSPVRATTDGSIAVRSVPVLVARELLEAGHLYLDVRTAEEFEAGHVEGAVNVPYLLKHAGGMTKNPDFLAQILEKFSKDDEIVVGCQSGRRSLMAVKELHAADFSGVTDMGGGYLAWVQSGLPVVAKA